MGFFTDFKKFISRGNVIDMAVGVVVGGAFSKIVTTFVSSIITPCISALTNGNSIAGQVILKQAVPATETTPEVPAVILDYGTFIQTIIDFLIIAFCIFVVIRIITKMREKAEALKKKEEEAPAAPPAPPAPSAEEKLLTEIRDLLKDKQ